VRGKVVPLDLSCVLENVKKKHAKHSDLVIYFDLCMADVTKRSLLDEVVPKEEQVEEEEPVDEPVQRRKTNKRGSESNPIELD
ncbi:hypothetical protein PFISCL1PPCAC_27944, partial [Pristionchus fissidentatus]